MKVGVLWTKCRIPLGVFVKRMFMVVADVGEQRQRVYAVGSWFRVFRR